MLNNAVRSNRQLGKPIFLQNTSVLGLLNQKNRILQAIDQNGCICLKNIDLNPRQLFDFTKGMWDEVVWLPKNMCLNNIQEDIPQVARVGNVLPTGTLKDSSRQAITWHQDGDFWGEGRNHIFNCLHTKIKPQSGGDTHFMDLVKAAQFLKTYKTDIYNLLQNSIGQLNVEQITVFKQSGVKNTLGIQTVTLHQLVKKFGRYGYQQVLFLSVMNLLDKNTHRKIQDVRIEQIHSILQEEMGFYVHKWQQGDMIIYDNLQVIHKASGKFQGKRLLIRTQGRNKN